MIFIRIDYIKGFFIQSHLNISTPKVCAQLRDYIEVRLY